MERSASIFKYIGNIFIDYKMKNEIFSFRKIEPSLVFFNSDGATYSIISNNDKNKENRLGDTRRKL